MSSPRVLAHFDRAAGQAAESIALEPDGGVVIGMIPARQVVRVAKGGAVTTLVTMPLPADGGAGVPVAGSAQVTGVARTDDGSLYFLYNAGNGMTGIWRVLTSGGAELVVRAPDDAFLNALVVDSARHRFLVTDSAGGRIFTAPLSGGTATVWSADPALAPIGFFGANGLKIHRGAVWASNSDAGTVVRVPVTRDGAAGRASVRAENLSGIDDFDFTGSGDEILAALNADSELVRVGPDGTRRTLLDSADGLQGTTSVVVRGDRAYVTNGAYLSGGDPTLMRVTLIRSSGRAVAQGG